ncbi:hypothetical protein HS088_TW15G00387 [Tripterygium wilfordii]|uniref:Uncharacterized protein n=1 Tax=Tripterygium wilfordii TaxID=458696 RepID=A0A7J7CLF5_TRIWF|nr:hypothetical protein HS088_TW15G00387 [Tripterygium wilfordii]
MSFVVLNPLTKDPTRQSEISQALLNRPRREKNEGGKVEDLEKVVSKLIRMEVLVTTLVVDGSLGGGDGDETAMVSRAFWSLVVQIRPDEVGLFHGLNGLSSSHRR